MANNQYVNKVEYAGQTLMDLTGDTVAPGNVLSGETFHDRSGTPQQGSLITHNVYDGLDSTSTDDALSAKQGKVLSDHVGKIDPNIITCTSLSDFQSKLNTLLASMVDGEERNIVYAPSGTYAPFAGVNHAGMLYRVNSSNAWCDLRRNGVAMFGTLQSGTWTSWKEFATTDQVATKVKTVSPNNGATVGASESTNALYFNAEKSDGNLRQFQLNDSEFTLQNRINNTWSRVWTIKTGVMRPTDISSNLNNAKDSGLVVYTNGEASGISNKPPDTNGKQVIVVKGNISNDKDIVQIAVDRLSGGIKNVYMRNYINGSSADTGTWTSWIPIYRKGIFYVTIANNGTITIDASKGAFIFGAVYDGFIAYIKSDATIKTLSGTVSGITVTGSGASTVIKNTVGWNIGLGVLSL